MTIHSTTEPHIETVRPLPRITPPSLLDDSFCVLILGLFSLVIFRHVLAVPSETFFVYLDNVHQFFAWYQKLSIAVHHGYLPLWDADALCGHSFVGEFQEGVFYPPNLAMVLLFGSTKGIACRFLDALIVGHFFLASVGMFAVLRTWGLSRTAGIAGGLIFAYGGAVAYRAAAQSCIFFGLCLVPWMWFFLARYDATRRKRYLLLAGVVMGLQVLAGHVQPFLNTAMMAAFYTAFLFFDADLDVWRRIKSLMFQWTILAAGAAAVCWPQMILSLQYLGRSYRWVSSPVDPIGPGQKVPFDTYSNKYIIAPGDLLNLFDMRKFPIEDNNHLYVGLMPLALLVILLARPKARHASMAWSRHRHLLLALTIFGLLCVLGSTTFFPEILYRLPLLDKVRSLGRYVIILHTVLALSAAMGVETLVAVPLGWSMKQRAMALGVAAFGAAECWYLAYARGSLVSQDFIWQAALVVILGFGAAVAGGSRMMMGLTALTLIALGIALNSPTFIPRRTDGTFAPRVFDRNPVITYLEQYYGRYRVLVEDDAMSPNIGDVYALQTKMGHGATMDKPFFDFIGQDWGRDSAVNDLLNVRFVVSLKPLDLPLVMTAGNLRLYERKNWYPRVFFQRHLGLPGREIETQEQVELLEYRDMRVRWRINSDRAEQVIFSELNYPGWTARVDGGRVPIVTAEIPGMAPLFRSIALPAGVHEVEMRYLAPMPY